MRRLVFLPMPVNTLAPAGTVTARGPADSESDSELPISHNDRCSESVCLWGCYRRVDLHSGCQAWGCQRLWATRVLVRCAPLHRRRGLPGTTRIWPRQRTCLSQCWRSDIISPVPFLFPFAPRAASACSWPRNLKKGRARVPEIAEFELWRSLYFCGFRTTHLSIKRPSTRKFNCSSSLYYNSYAGKSMLPNSCKDC